MKNLWLTLVVLLLCANVASALDIVYPKQSGVTINSPSTFFVGSANPDFTLTVNDAVVRVHPSGGFVFPVKLLYGTNSFQIKSGNEIISFKMFRQKFQPVLSNKPSSSEKLTEYSESKIGNVICANAVLRATPVNQGINRIAHLPEGTEIIADGERRDFYRVVLGLNKRGWISKSDVKINPSHEDAAELQDINYLDDGEYYKYIFKLSKRVPWSIEEENGLKISIFNLKNIKENTFLLRLPGNTIYVGKSPIGYGAEYEGNNLIIKIRKPLSVNYKHPLKDIKIVVDAGHGGKEIGTTGCLRDKEKDFNLKYASELESELISRGAKVIMTRTGDTDVSLSERVNIAKNEDAVVFISLHGNALPDSVDPTNVHGTEIYYYYNQARPLAESIMNEIKKIPDASTRGIIQQSFAVVRNTNALSLLIEVGYMINPADNALILSDDFRKNIIRAIADGIESYFSSSI